MLICQGYRSGERCGLLICGPGRTEGFAKAGNSLLQRGCVSAQGRPGVVVQLAFADASDRNLQGRAGISECLAKKLPFGRMDHWMRAQNLFQAGKGTTGTEQDGRASDFVALGA